MKDFVFFLKNKIFRHAAFKEYMTALRNMDLTRNELESLNWKKRVAIIQHAYENCKFYHDFYDSLGFSPYQLKDPDDWHKVPILEKFHIRQNVDGIINVDKSLLRENVTGGSTGEPLKCYHDSRFHQEILDWRMYKVWNISPAENKGKIWRMSKLRESGFFKFKNRLIWFPTRQINMDSSDVTDFKISSFLEELRKQDSCMLYGYTGSISEIAKYIIKNKLSEFKRGKIKLVTTFASPITSVDRDLVEQAFGCSRILDQYCCNEISSIAFSSPLSVNLYVNYDYRHLDIVDKDGCLVKEPDIQGDVLITDLSNYGFPLIKYRLGDTSSWVSKKESDGLLPFPQIKPIKGRITDMIRLPDGSSLDGSYLTTIFDPYPNAVLGFQIHQKIDYSIDFFVIPNDSNKNSMTEIDKVTGGLMTKSRNLVPINLKIVQEIKSDRGKQRYIISDLNNLH